MEVGHRDKHNNPSIAHSEAKLDNLGLMKLLVKTYYTREKNFLQTSFQVGMNL